MYIPYSFSAVFKDFALDKDFKSLPEGYNIITVEGLVVAFIDGSGIHIRPELLLV